MRSIGKPCWHVVGLLSRSLVVLPFLVLLATHSRQVFAGNNVWTSMGLEGASLVAVAPQDPSTIYAAINFFSRGGAQVFKSTDAGTHWNASSALPTPTFPSVYAYSLAIDPQNPNVIFVATNWGVFKTTDGGVTWRDTGLPASTQFLSLALDPQNPDVIFVGTSLGDSRVFKSIDGGWNWITPQFTFEEPVCSPGVALLVVDPQNSNNVYAATGDCNDAIMPAQKSMDGGTTWAPLNVFIYAHANIVAIDPKNPNTLYAGSLGKIAKSIDGGKTWSTANSGLPERFDVVSLAIDAENPSTLYAAGYSSGIFKSIDSGVNWTPLNPGLRLELMWIGSLILTPRGPNTLYATTSRGVLKLDDTPVLSLDSAEYCIGDSWNLKVSNGGANTSIRLLGTSNGQSWQVPDWRKTAGDGGWTEAGTFIAGTEGSHSLRTDIDGTLSNVVSFVVSNCRP